MALREFAATTLLIGLWAAAPAATAAPPDGDAGAAPPRVLLLATGGTIAGVQNDPADPDVYRAGSLDAAQIVASVPALAQYARVEPEQFANVPSPLITPAQWLALSRRIDAAFAADDELAGVVVTHGTSRLEETAFFLYLTVRAHKPVVLVGAQRPATGTSPDGPQNLLDAVRTAAAPAAVGKGVLVVMDGRILSARDVRKDYERVGGFGAGSMGMLGVLAHEGPLFFYQPARPHGGRDAFDLDGIEALPEVDLQSSYPGGAGPRYAKAPPGVVVASSGFTCEETLAYLRLARAGTVVVTAFPGGDNVAREWPPEDRVPARVSEPCAHIGAAAWEGRWIPPIEAQRLTPNKARILLMLALARTRDDAAIRRMFSRY
jgi:L-asparaginase/Glu-tRNA(Gln) amidotransferase subunit D